MAATRATGRFALPTRALMTAALTLPGVAATTAEASDDDEFAFQYGRYVEGERELFDTRSEFDPIEAETLLARWRVTLRDRIKLAFAYIQDTWSGATPVATGPLVLGGNARPPDGFTGATPFINGDLFLDADLTPLDVDPFGQVLGRDDRLVHVLSSASPETRKQGSLGLGYEWDDARLDVGGGLSIEEDYQSGFVDLKAELDLDEKRTQLSLGGSYTRSEIDARLDHDIVPYLDTTAFDHSIHTSRETGHRSLRDERDDFGAEVGVTRVLNRNAFLEASGGWVHSSGYQANPYKALLVAFIDPAQQFLAPPGGFFAQVRALLERPPAERNQFTGALGLVHYVPGLRASLRLGYRLHLDDWGIDAHTAEVRWGQPLGDRLIITPRVRYYTQSEASFYEPYLVSPQAFRTVVSDPDTGDILSITPFDHRLLPSHYSSDHRLSAFGALSAGVSASARLGRGVTLEGDFEYYTHRGSLKLGGGGEDEFADFDAYFFSAALVLDSSVLTEEDPHRGSEPAASAHAHAVPAGVMMAHMLREPGELMLGLHQHYGRQAGDILSGTSRASDAEILALGCPDGACRTVGRDMEMSHYVLDLMWAPTGWLNLMIAPRFVDHSMDLRGLRGGVADVHNSHGHTTGGIGDTTLAALVHLFELRGLRAHLGLGVSAPTGDVSQEFRRTHQIDRGRLHYAMQLGSGTWDLLPSLTLLGHWRRFSWGAQAGGIWRLERENRSGYALGDVFETTGWAGFALSHWLSVTGRVLFADEGDIRGEFDRPHDDAGPMDFPQNHGGRFWDVGVGLSVRLPFFAGNQLGVEWLQPVAQDLNGFQLERKGMLAATWSVEF